MKDLNQDFRELITSFTSHRVEFLVVGAHALAFHGLARYTEDLHVWVRASEENVERVKAALHEFGIPISDEHASALLRERHMIWFGREPRKIEILNFLDGCDFESSWETAAECELDGVRIKVLSLESFVKTKKASGRAKDFSDLTMLRERIGPLPGDEA